MAFGAFDLLEGLDVFVFRPVHDREDFCDKMLFIARPVAACAGIERLHVYQDIGRAKQNLMAIAVPVPNGKP